MWPFSRQPRRASRLTGISGQLWSYDARHHKGWRLETERRVPARQPRAPRAFSGRTGGAREKLTHYIRSGGMRHETRDRSTRRQPVDGQRAVWRLFFLFIVLWVIGRCLPR